MTTTRRAARSLVLPFGGIVSTFGLGVALFACDKVYADPITTPFTASTSFFDSGLTSTRLPPTPCPRNVAENAPCSKVSAVCEAGESPDPKCNSTFVCVQDNYDKYWTEQTPPSCLSTCPAPSAIQDGAPCEIPDAGSNDAELQCPGVASVCACTTGPDGAHSHPRRWVCVRPQDKDNGCIPDKRPLLGQPCVGDHVCNYGACDFKRGTQMICEDDVWQIEVAQCD